MENFKPHAIKRLVTEGEISKIQEPIENIKKNIEYISEIPVEKGKYYRVTGISEILSIVKNKSLASPENSFYDRRQMAFISKNSNYSIEDLEFINAKNPSQIREIYNEHISKPNKEKGIITLVARTKSNHGDIGFVKEGFFYNPLNKEGSHFGAPVIVGSEELSLFEQGVHGSRHGVFNKEIESKKPAILKEGNNAENFEYWLYETEKGWHKNNFDSLVNFVNEKYKVEDEQ